MEQLGACRSLHQASQSQAFDKQILIKSCLFVFCSFCLSVRLYDFRLMFSSLSFIRFLCFSCMFSSFRLYDLMSVLFLYVLVFSFMCVVLLCYCFVLSIIYLYVCSVCSEFHQIKCSESDLTQGLHDAIGGMHMMFLLGSWVVAAI